MSMEGGNGDVLRGTFWKKPAHCQWFRQRERTAVLLSAGFFLCHTRCLGGEWFEAEYLATHSKHLLLIFPVTSAALSGGAGPTLPPPPKELWLPLSHPASLLYPAVLKPGR